MSYEILNIQDYKQVGVVIISKDKTVKGKFYPEVCYRLLELDEVDKTEFPCCTHRIANYKAPYVYKLAVQEDGTTKKVINNNNLFYTNIVKQTGKCTFILWDEEENRWGDKKEDFKLYFNHIIDTSEEYKNSIHPYINQDSKFNAFFNYKH